MLENKYRPQDWADLILPTKGRAQVQVAMVRRAVEAGIQPLRLWIDGPSGTGKTTLARMIASKIGNTSVKVEIDGADVTAKHVETWTDWFRARATLFGPAVVIVNEFQNLGAAVKRFMTLCDGMASGVLIFTTMTHDNVLFDDATDDALKGRCMQVNIRTEGTAQAAAIRLLEIARKEGLDFGADAARVLRLVQDNKNNIRKTLSAIGEGALCNNAALVKPATVAAA